MSELTTPLATILSAPLHICAVLAMGAIFLMMFVVRWRRLVDTTLVAPWVWAGICFATIVGVEVAVAANLVTSWSASLRYVAAMSTFCPIVALLGAKRPQDKGWQWIVLSLWVILCQPAGEWILFGGVAEIHPARFWFLVILMVVGATNGLGTRFWISSLTYAAGQLVLLLPYFSLGAGLDAGQATLVGLGAILVSWTLVVVGFFPGRKAEMPLDRVWLDFRDQLGVVWALRIMERVNTSAKMYDWPVTLAWHGFQPRSSTAHVEMPDLVEDSFRTLLRRFVSPAWIDQRIDAAMKTTNVESPGKTETV